jgi:hypothetical protein
LQSADAAQRLGGRSIAACGAAISYPVPVLDPASDLPNDLDALRQLVLTPPLVNQVGRRLS